MGIGLFSQLSGKWAQVGLGKLPSLMEPRVVLGSPWRCSGNERMWHFVTWFSGGMWGDLMIMGVFSSLCDPLRGDGSTVSRSCPCFPRSS